MLSSKKEKKQYERERERDKKKTESYMNNLVGIEKTIKAVDDS